MLTQKGLNKSVSLPWLWDWQVSVMHEFSGGMVWKQIMLFAFFELRLLFTMGAEYGYSRDQEGSLWECFCEMSVRLMSDEDVSCLMSIILSAL